MAADLQINADADPRTIAPCSCAHDALNGSDLPLRTTADALEERLRFETMLSDLSARFINLPADQVDSEIEAGLRRLVESVGLDRSTLFQLSPDEKTLVVTHGWAAPGFETIKRLAAQVLANALERKRAEQKLVHALAEIKQLQDRLHQENIYLRQEVKLVCDHEQIIGQSRAIKRVLSQVEKVAGTEATVLLLGETGTGKELLATAIHNLSPRRDRPMVRVNCAALPASLVESELFGREKGAYTGALSKQVGRFELAHDSTIFLDEVGDLPPEVQVKLLRVLQEGILEHLGSPRPIRVNVRVIAATHGDLALAVRDGRFREDLFYRLNVFPITLPPLRERPEDIPLLVWAIVEEFAKSLGKTIQAVAKESMEGLQRYPWPGNVRELRNIIERAMITGTGQTLRVPAPGISDSAAAKSMALEDVEREHILRALELTRWRIRGKDGAAEMLGIKPTTLDSRMARLGTGAPASDRRSAP